MNAALLKEYGLTDFESGTYTRDDGRKVALKAIRFADASGAYGAFTYYKMPQMLTESVPDQGASLNERVLFYRGNILVDAVFDKLSAMSAAELRDLSGGLPLPTGNTRNLPILPQYLPKSGYVKNTAKYILGPVGPGKDQRAAFSAPGGLQRQHRSGAGQLPDCGRDRHADAHRVSDAAAGGGTLCDRSMRPISPRRKREIRAANAGPIFSKRTGPIVAIATGAISPGEARSLLSGVNYEADVNWTENTYQGKKNNLGNLLINVFLLCGILIVFAGVAGVAFGGIRIFLQSHLAGEGAAPSEGRGFHLPEPVRRSGRGGRFQGKPINQSRLGERNPAKRPKWSADRPVNLFSKLLNPKIFISQKSLDEPLFRLIRFRQKVLTDFLPRWNYSPLKEKAAFARAAFLFSRSRSLQSSVLSSQSASTNFVE